MLHHELIKTIWHKSTLRWHASLFCLCYTSITLHPSHIILFVCRYLTLFYLRANLKFSKAAFFILFVWAENLFRHILTKFQDHVTCGWIDMTHFLAWPVKCTVNSFWKVEKFKIINSKSIFELTVKLCTVISTCKINAVNSKTILMFLRCTYYT